jgi:hypothetical protein
LTHKEGQRLKAIPEVAMQQDYPRAYTYLKRFESTLRSRKTQVVRRLMETGPFYSLFAVGDYTFAPWKVVWRELANELDAAVVNELDVHGERKPVVPDHTCILVECENHDEAHYLCAMVNSSPARLAIRNYIVLHPDPHVLNNIHVPQFSPKNRTHAKLAELSEAAHKAATKGDEAEVEHIEKEVNQWAAKLWNLSDEELAEIKRSLEEM